MPKRYRTPDVGGSAAAELKGSARRAKEIIEGLRDAFVAVDARWRITECNRRAEDILGRGRSELLGHTLWEVSGVAPDSPLAQVARRVRRTGEPEESEFTLALDGVERLLSVRGFPLGAGVGVTAGDITELRRAERRLAESEARFRELADGAPALTWMAGADGTVEYVSPAMLNMLDLSEAEFLGSGWQRRIHPDDLPELRRAKARQSRFGHTVRVRRGDGAWRTLQVAAVPRFDAQGAFRGYVGVSTDVSEFVAAQKRQELLISELNHRVRNTLSTVHSMVRQTLKDSPAAKGTLEVLTDRLMALAAAHNILSREHWAGAELSEMARLAVSPFDPDGRRVAIAGPRARLYPGAALALFMAINELATNAVRHGALGAPEGRVSLSWTRRDGALELEWRESGGPRVSPPARKGFGSRLLGAGIASELGAPAEITYAPEGLICRIRAPAMA